MKRVLIALFVLAFACKVEKTGKDTYKVVAPTPEAKAAAQKVKEEVKVVGQEVKEGAAKAAQEAGGALQRAGEKVEQKTETTATSKTGTRSKTSTRH